MGNLSGYPGLPNNNSGPSIPLDFEGTPTGPQARDPIAGLATYSPRAAFPREADRDRRHALVMAMLYQLVPYSVQ